MTAASASFVRQEGRRRRLPGGDKGLWLLIDLLVVFDHLLGESLDFRIRRPRPLRHLLANEHALPTSSRSFGGACPVVRLSSTLLRDRADHGVKVMSLPLAIQFDLRIIRDMSRARSSS